MKTLEYLITAVRSAPGLNGPKGLRKWWEGALLREFQAALRDRQLLSGTPGCISTCY